ncbi:hypothetical protein Nmel_010659, partial [Mimus melanotis]
AGRDRPGRGFRTRAPPPDRRRAPPRPRTALPGELRTRPQLRSRRRTQRARRLRTRPSRFHGARSRRPARPGPAQPAPGAVPPHALAARFALPPRVPMALKRIQKGGGRAPCPGIIARATPLLPGFKAAAGPGSVRGVAAAAALHFLCQDSSFPRRQPGKKCGCQAKGGRVGRLTVSGLLEGPALGVGALTGCLWTSRNALSGVRVEESREAQGHHQSPKRLRCRCAYLIRTVLRLLPGLRSAVSIVLGLNFERIPVVAELIAVQYRQGIAASTGGELRLVLWPWNRIRGVISAILIMWRCYYFLCKIPFCYQKPLVLQKLDSILVVLSHAAKFMPLHVVQLQDNFVLSYHIFVVNVTFDHYIKY